MKTPINNCKVFVKFSVLTSLGDMLFHSGTNCERDCSCALKFTYCVGFIVCHLDLRDQTMNVKIFSATHQPYSVIGFSVLVLCR